MNMPAITEAVRALTEGDGFLFLPEFFSAQETGEARTRLECLAAEEPDRASHFHGDAALKTQKRVWNLPEKGAVFRRMCSAQTLLDIMKPIIGDDLMLSSYAANITYPGAPAQEPHVDYPYWDLHTRRHWPQNLNASFFLAVEVVVMLDEFTIENGATAIVPRSHQAARWPDPDRFRQRRIQATGPAGTVLMFPALLWHAAQANRSQGARAALLGSYTTKCVKPIEDWSRCMSPATLKACSKTLKHLLGIGYAYPAVMDALPSRSSEGVRSKKPIARPY